MGLLRTLSGVVNVTGRARSEQAGLSRQRVSSPAVEILERAFDVTWVAIEASDQPLDLESDEELEAAAS
jgi:hypothetical protein